MLFHLRKIGSLIRSIEEKIWKRRINILQWDQSVILAKKQLHEGEQNVIKFHSEENRFCNKINRRKKLENRFNILHTMTLLHAWEQADNEFNRPRKIGSIIRSVEEKSLKTNLISNNETSASFCRKTTPQRKGNRMLQNKTAQHTTQCKIELTYASHCVSQNVKNGAFS